MTERQIEIVYQALQRYMQRVKLVQQAMYELSPYLIAPVPSQDASAEEKQNFRNLACYETQSGVWRDSIGREWKYFFHGIGLRLTSLTTQEVIDWDAHREYAEYLTMFDKSFFGSWFEWLFSTYKIIADEFSGDEVFSIFDQVFDTMENRRLIVRVGYAYKLNRV